MIISREEAIEIAAEYLCIAVALKRNEENKLLALRLEPSRALKEIEELLEKVEKCN